MSDGAEAVRGLAALLRCGLSPRAALCAWHEQLDDPFRRAAARLKNRLELGDTVDRSLASMEAVLGSDAASLRTAFIMQYNTGGDLARMLEGVAATIATRTERARTARAAAAGALLSARMVAGLPLVFVPLTPMARAPMFDVPGVVLLVSGAVLALAGLRWIARLVPVPPDADDPVAALADVVAAALRAGVELDAALSTVASHCPATLEGPLSRARARVALGSTWSNAVATSGDERLAAVAAVVERGRRFGIPVATALETVATGRRVAAARDFEVRLRRAPVLMVEPVTVCVLPSFALLALAPFVRGLSLGV